MGDPTRGPDPRRLKKRRERGVVEDCRDDANRVKGKTRREIIRCLKRYAAREAQ
ncbi:hypothetical protein AB0E10_32900 [Streptomyces sp. NPDC048045]|uniref:hypothetical protein n=1 Tax=Streptomyces sp. NPDC048045 TaxID=3154710 RepID=UPI0034399224